MIIGNVKYEQYGLNAKGGTNWADLPNVEANVKKAKEIVDFLGLEDHYQLTDCTQQQVKDAIVNIKNVFNVASTNDRDKIFLFVFYAGHG